MARSRLLGRLQSLGEDVSLVVVNAPVGSGKTTLASQFSALSGRPTAWLHVTRAHRDPAVLVRDLALELMTATRASGLLGDLARGSRRVPPDQAAVRLARAVELLGRPLVVLDDLHEARSTASLELVARTAELLPPGARLLATLDRPPRLPITRLGGTGRAAELDADDLAFDADEVTTLLDRAGVPAARSAADAVLEHTEGWVTGVRRAADLLAEAPDPVAAASTLSGDQPPFADWLRTQVLAGLSVETVRFLMRTSVLPRLSGDLCDAALDTGGSAAWLGELLALGLPLVALDHQGRWWRYSRLFGEMLAAELRRREAGEDVRVLRRASAWFAGHVLPEEAVDCAVAAGDEDLVADLLVVNAQLLNSQGRIDRARAWLDGLHETTIERNPPLAAMAVWILGLTGEPAGALHALRVAEAGTVEGALADGSASLESAVRRGRAALAPDGLTRMLHDAQEAVRLEPPGSAWHTMAGLLLGCAQRLTGATEEAARSFELAARYGRRNQHAGASFALAERALLAADQEDWAIAEACLTEAQRLVGGAGLEQYGPTVAVHLAAARVALHHGELDLGRVELQCALELYRVPSPNAFPWLAAQAAIELGRLCLALGRLRAAEARLAEARRHLAVLGDAGLLTAWAEGLADDVRRARNVEEAQDSLLTPAELRVLTLLPTHLSLAQIGDELVTSRNTIKSQVAAIYRKLGATNRADAVRRAGEAHLVDVPASHRPAP